MKALKQNWQAIVVCIAILATAFLFVFQSTVYGSTTNQQPPPAMGLTTFQLFASTTPAGGETYATTTSATSTNIALRFNAAGIADNGTVTMAGAKKVNFFFHRGDTSGQGNTGTSTFRVQVQAPDGTWMYWGKWQENASSTINFLPTSLNATQAFTLVGTSTVTAAMVLDEDNFASARCIVVEVTDGEHSCTATVTY